MLKIGFITTEYALAGDAQGGLGNYLRRIAQALAATGIQPHIYYYTDKPSGVQVHNGLPVHIIDSRHVNTQPGQGRWASPKQTQ